MSLNILFKYVHFDAQSFILKSNQRVNQTARTAMDALNWSFLIHGLTDGVSLRAIRPKQQGSTEFEKITKQLPNENSNAMLAFEQMEKILKHAKEAQSKKAPTNSRNARVGQDYLHTRGN